MFRVSSLFKTIPIVSALVVVVASTYVYYQHKEPAQAAVTCTVSDKLVNSCRPWLGAWSNTYPGHTDTGLQDMITDHENRIGRQIDMPHMYLDQGQTLTTPAKYYINRPNTYPLINWKPANPWRDGAGGNATVNAQIDAMADSIKSMAPKKISLIIYHEPENDIDHSSTTCPLPVAVSNMGSAADYKDMWHNVRARFDARGVTNVVWGINYMMYPGGTCIIKELWPGNSYVDWVWSDPYIEGTGTRPTFFERMDFTYDWFKNNSDATYDFASKPWGIAEWGIHQSTQQQAYDAYTEAKQALETNRYPNLKAMVIFDARSGPKGGGAVGQRDDGTPDPVEQQKYNEYANSPYFTDSFYDKTPADSTAPIVQSLSVSPLTVGVGGTISASVNATDNIGVTKVEFYSAGVLKGTDTDAPFTASWAAATVGQKDITAKVYDAAGNATTSTSVSLTVVASTPPSTPGDVNGDGRINALDLSMVISHDGQDFPAADFNADGTVGAADLAIVLARWTW